MTGVYKIIVKNNLVYKYLDKYSEIGKLLNERLKHKNHLEYFNFQVCNGYRKDFIGKHIVIGYLFHKRGDYTSPLINGILLDKIKLEDLDYETKIQFLYSLQDIYLNLYNYKKKFNTLTGDWTLHNLIWDRISGDIVNIDLEGFYTYSKYGPPLPWVKIENTWSYIRNMIKKLKKPVINQLKYRDRQNFDINQLTLIYLPTAANIQWIFPYKISNIHNNLVNRVFSIDLGDLAGYKTELYNVYFLIKNQDKVSCLIKKNGQKDIPEHAVFMFQFKANIEEGYEHPIRVNLISGNNPCRTILNIDKVSSDFFYAKKFSKCG